MAWKMLKRSDCQNQIQEERVKLKNMSSGTYFFEFTGKQWVNKEEGESFPVFKIIREEDLQVMGESTVSCPARMPEEIKNSAVLFQESYKIAVEDGVVSLIPR